VVHSFETNIDADLVHDSGAVGCSVDTDVDSDMEARNILDGVVLWEL